MGYGSSGSSNTDSGDVSGGDTTGDTAGTVIRPLTHPVTVIVQVAGKPAAPIAAAMIPHVSGVDTSGGHDTLMTALSSDNSDDISNNQDVLAILKLQAVEILVLKTDQAVPAGQGFRDAGTMTAPWTMSLPAKQNSRRGHQHQKKSLFLNIRFPMAQPT